MRRTAFLLCLIGLFGPGPSLSARPFTALDLATLDRPSDPRLSPDGRWVLFDLRSVDFAANKASHALWLADSTGGSAPRRLAISEGGAASGRWSPDGSRIYFLSGRQGGIDQVWQTDRTGDRAVPVTHLPFDVGAYRLAPDGKTLVVSQAVFPDCAELACSQARLAKALAEKPGGVVFDHLFIRHWDKWADGTRNHLFALALDQDGVAGGPARDLMAGLDGDVPNQPFGDDNDFAISANSRDLVFSAKIAGASEAWSTNFDLFTVPLDGSAAPRALTAGNPAADATPVFAPEGGWLAYRAQRRPGFESDRYGVMLRDVVSGSERELAPDWDRSADQIAWAADGQSLVVLAEDLGQTRLFRVRVKDGSVTALTGPGHVGGFDLAGGRLVAVADDLSAPPQLFVSHDDGGHRQKLTHFNERQLQDVAWGDAQQFSFKGWNNEPVYGFVVKPSGWVAGKRYPVAFLIHGGPQGSFGNMFHFRWNAETFAGAGFAVVMVDFHGSTGYGQAFTDSISRHWGDRPLEDLQKGWDFALAHYPFLDGGRACALGGSYGGYMINWIAGVWNQPWRCLVNHDGIFDTRFMGSSTEELWFSEWENGGTPYQPDSDFALFNPADHAAAWRKPTLVVEGGKDYRVPLEEAIATFTALQRQGVPSKLLYFPEENHWVLKPHNLVQWYGEVTAWLERWTAVE